MKQGVVHVFVPRPLWATHLHEQHVPSTVAVEVRDPDPQGMYVWGCLRAGRLCLQLCVLVGGGWCAASASQHPVTVAVTVGVCPYLSLHPWSSDCITVLP
jgi:hypothetical protein